MKQLELNRLLNTILKKEAKARGWRSIAGQCYWRDGQLFFALLAVGLARQHSLHLSLRFKWFSLDDQLWAILDMSSNLRAPVSLRANGAFTLQGQEILKETVQDCEWSEHWLEARIHAVSTAAADRSAQVVRGIANIDDYLAVLEQEHALLMTRYPKAVVDIWSERLLVALEKRDRAKVVEIARARIDAQDPGSFLVGGRSFYQRALEYVEGAA